MSSSVCDVHRYIIISKLLYAIYNILPVLMRLWEIQTHLHVTSLPTVAYIRYYVPLFVEWPSFSNFRGHFTRKGGGNRVSLTGSETPLIASGSSLGIQ
jgi:hypothetical protein